MNLITKNYGINSWDNFFNDSDYRVNDIRCDIYEKDSNYYVEADIPGFNKEDIKVLCENGYLTIEVRKNEVEEDENKEYYRKERKYGNYKRTFYIGNVNNDNVKASFNNGILKICIPKDSEEYKKEIKID